MTAPIKGSNLEDIRAMRRQAVADLLAEGVSKSPGIINTEDQLIDFLAKFHKVTYKYTGERLNLYFWETEKDYQKQNPSTVCVIGNLNLGLHVAGRCSSANVSCSARTFSVSAVSVQAKAVYIDLLTPEVVKRAVEKADNQRQYQSSCSTSQKK